MELSGFAGGPAHLVLTETVARMFYVDGRSKVEIARDLDISRFRVARLLEQARASGLVRVEIGHPGSIDTALSKQLREHLGLRTVIVVDTAERDPAALRKVLGQAAGALLAETVTRDDVLGLAWARSVASTVAALASMPPVPVVQLTGSLARDDVAATSIELVREVARITGAPAMFFYAPFLLPDIATATTLRRQPDVARAIRAFPSVTRAVVGLGAWADSQSTIHDAMSPRERAVLDRAGAVADLSGIFLDEDGAVVGREQTARMICMDAEQLAAVGDVMAVPYGVARARAVLAAVRSGLLTTLVTHTDLANTLVATAPVHRAAR